MKQTRIFIITILAAMLLVTACSPVGFTDRLQALANSSQVTAGGAVSESNTTAPITRVAAQAPTAIPVVAKPAPTTVESGLLAAYEGTLEQVYARVNPSVVNIQVVTRAAGPVSFRGSPSGQGIQEGLGSGFVWDTQGHIVTNNHVVEGADEITVIFSNGNEYSAKLVGTDPNADLAVIKVEAPAGDLQPVALADSTQVRVGELAIAIGNPFGLSGTMTQGIISALSRSLPVSEGESFGQSGATYSIPDIIQTDAAINPGNSGGVLVDELGQVIGVTAAIKSASNSNSGIGFVIPSAIVSRVVPSIISSGTYEHPYMGVSGVNLSSSLAEELKLDAKQKGVLIIEVSSGTPAERAGLRGSTIQANASGAGVPTGGDIITAVDGQAVTRMEDLTSYLFNNTRVGQTVTLTVLRQGREQAVKLTLGALPQSTGQ
jgi:2-alkenal reductase